MVFPLSQGFKWRQWLESTTRKMSFGISYVQFVLLLPVVHKQNRTSCSRAEKFHNCLEFILESIWYLRQTTQLDLTILQRTRVMNINYINESHKFSLLIFFCDPNTVKFVMHAKYIVQLNPTHATLSFDLYWFSTKLCLRSLSVKLWIKCFC